MIHAKKLLLILLTALMLVGCAYRNHMKAGDELYAKGQYEAALNQYEAALVKKPASEDAQQKVADAKSAMVREYTQDTRAHLEAGDYVSAIESSLALRERLPEEAAVRQLARDVSSATQLEASRAAESQEWATALELLQRVYDAYEEDRESIDPELQRLKTTWSQTLAAKALISENKGFHGDALLLYSKASELVLDPTYVSKRDELRAKVLSETSYKVKIEGTGREPKSVTALLMTSNFPHNVLIGKDKNIKSPDAIAKLSMDSPKFTKSKSSSKRTARYKSGTKQVPNPQYKSRQDAVLREERDLKRYEDDVSKAQRDISNYQKQVAREGDTPGTSTGAEQGLSRAQSELERALNNTDSARDRVMRAKEDLADTDQTTEEDVYSDLEYTVTTHTLSGRASVKLTLTHEDGRERKQLDQAVGISASDSTNAAHPIANVSEDPLELPSEQALSQDLRVQAANLSWGLINESLQQRRQQLLDEALKTTDDDARMHLYAVYILLDPTNVNPQVTADITSARGIPDSTRVLSQPVQ